MQRYHPGNCTSAVNNSAIGGASARDSARADSASLPANYSLNSRRQPPLAPFKLKCEKDSLNSRLGPPDFHPQTPNCPEETLTKEYAQVGYKESVEGLEEARELTLTQTQSFSKPVLFKCREAIRKCLRAINESRAQKRKAGQVYGVPLADLLLTKPGVFPEQRPCSEDFRKKWIEGLSQQHKRLRTLADHVPHGYRKRSLFEVLIRNNVPLLRATWFIKVTYLNQVRPGSGSNTSGGSDKAQLSRTEIWTKDVIEYLQLLLDEFLSKNNSYSTLHIRDRSSQMLYSGSVHQRGDPISAGLDSEDSSLHFKWWYMVRLLQWHYAEGLILPSLIIDWVLRQLQDKESLEIVQLLLPIIYGVLETVVLSQTYVRSLVGIAVRFIREPSPGGSDLVDNSRKAYTTSALVEMLRYLLVAVPDTFVALDCFPLPSCVVSHAVTDGSLSKSASEDVKKIKVGSSEFSSPTRNKGLDAQYQSLALDHVVSSIQKRADDLSKAAHPGCPGRSVAKVVEALDKSCVQGDVRVAYKFLFEDLCEGAVNDRWMAEVSPCLRSSLKWIGSVNLSFVCSVFLLCEWATCDFRDFRTSPPDELKFTGRKDFSHVYIAIRLLKQKIGGSQNSPKSKNDSSAGVSILKKCSSQPNSFSGRTSAGELYDSKSSVKNVDHQSTKKSCIFESPGPLHDIIVCWIDQHEACKGDGSQRLQLLIMELIRAGIFYPQAYVRQLMVSGIMEMNGSIADADRKRRHHRILKQLSGVFVRDALEEAGFAEGPQLLEAMHNYSNERRLVLCGLLCNNKTNPSQSLSVYPAFGKDGASSASFDQWKAIQSASNILSNRKTDVDVEELKEAISVLLQLPDSPSKSTDTGLDDALPSVKRSSGSLYSKMDIGEGTPGCEECKRAKRQKLGDERSSVLLGNSLTPSDDDDSWWVKKGSHSAESVKLVVESPLKPNKQVSRNKQKLGRKTTSLAQLAASRIEGSQGASTSHVCENKVSCPHHRTGVDGETPKSAEGLKAKKCGDIVSIGKALKRLRFVEKRSISVWLMTAIRQAVEDTEKTMAKAGQLGRGFVSVDDKNGVRWKLGEDELSSVLYLMDVSNDLVLAVKFILWLLPKVSSSPNSTMHGGRSSLLIPRTVESQVCEVGETFLISSLRRYENVLIAQDLIPEALSSVMHRAAAAVASNGRVSGSSALFYARYLLRRYGKVASVVEWEKSFRTTCDKRLFSELESGRSGDGELSFPLGVPAGVEDLDDFFRQKMSNLRTSRVGATMRDLVQRNLNIEDVLQYFFGKDRKVFAAGSTPKPIAEKWDNAIQVAQKVISDLMDCIRQTGGAAQEGDPSLVSSAVSAIVGNIGPTISKLPDFRTGSGFSSSPFATESLNIARRVLRVHITCLCLLKEALGERQTRVFEVALANEASSALAGVFAPGKGSRNQFQSSPEPHDSNSSMSNDNTSNSTKIALGRSTKFSAAVSSLIVGAVVHGVTSLERMVTVFRLKEGLDIGQFIKNTRSSSNGSARSLASKTDSILEVYVHWFRLLAGNCRTVSDGLVVELLGEPSIVALSRMQRVLPIGLVFPPAYSIFAYVIWRPFIPFSSLLIRDDINQLYNSLSAAINDAIRHLPFRDACLRDSQGFYDLVAADCGDADFASIFDSSGSDMHKKSRAFTPLRARLFLNAIIDCKMPEDGNRASGQGESKTQFAEAETKVLKKLVVHILDTLQPAKFHWQWIELRLLLNEQTLVDKLEQHDMTLKDAILSSAPSSMNAASEHENNFIQIVLARLLARPDAASLFSDVVHLFGSSLADSVLLQARWFLCGPDVLLGRKSVRQRLMNMAEPEGLSTKPLFSKPWGWYKSGFYQMMSGEKKIFEPMSLEEGEMAEEGTASKRSKKGSNQTLNNESINTTQQHVTERALLDLLLPCIDQSSDDSRGAFASDLIKQLNTIELQINAITRGMDKQAGPTTPGAEGGPVSKGNSRKVIKGGSPGLARRAPTSVADFTPPPPAALRASMLLRLQLLLRLLPVICTDGEPSGRNMRHTLASVVLRLLGSRIVNEDADLSFNPVQTHMSKRESETSAEAASAANVDLSGGSLFDRLLLVLHGLLSSCQPIWLRTKSASKLTNEYSKDMSALDRELTESLQNDLDRMQLPDMIRWRIQTAMPLLLPSVRCFVNCQPPTVPNAALACLQPFISTPGSYSGNLITPQRNQNPSSRSGTNSSGKSKSLPVQDHDTEIDPWTLLEDSAGSGQSSSNSGLIGSGGDHANLRASSWLKGAVRMRRKDLTYIGAVDDDS